MLLSLSVFFLNMRYYLSPKSFKQTYLKDLISINEEKKHLQYKCYMLWLRVHENITSLYIVKMSTRGSPRNCVNIGHKDSEKDH